VTTNQGLIGRKLLLSRLLPAPLYGFGYQSWIRLARGRRFRPLLMVRLSDRCWRLTWRDGSQIHIASPVRLGRYLRPGGAREAIDYVVSRYLGESLGSLENSPVILDIGANIGEFALGVHHAASHVYCIEPDPSVVEALRANTRPFSNITVLDICIGSDDGVQHFYLAHHGADSSLVSSRDVDGGAAVEKLVLTVSTLARMLGVKAFDLVKLDAEGAEPEVVSGSNSGVVGRWAIDVSPERDGQGTAPAVERLLVSQGYEVTLDGNILSAVAT
jgi:FkbM family methyltransferase